MRVQYSDDDVSETRDLEPDRQLIAMNVLQVGLIEQTEYTAWHTKAPNTTRRNEEILEKLRSKVGFLWFCFAFN